MNHIQERSTQTFSFLTSILSLFTFFISRKKRPLFGLCSKRLNQLKIQISSLMFFGLFSPLWAQTPFALPPSPPSLSTSSLPTVVPLPEHIMLSLKHFEELKQSANQHLELAQWSNIQIKLDLAQAHQKSPLVHIQITADLQGSKKAWVYLTPQMQTPIKAWLDQAILHPHLKGSHFVLPLGHHKKLKLSYTLPFEFHPQQGFSTLIPLPPLAHAQVSVVNAPSGWRLSPSLATGALSGQLSLKGALFLTLPPPTDKPFLQKQHMRLHIHAPTSELEQNALLVKEIEVNVPNPPVWIKVAPVHDALSSATLDGQNVPIRVHQNWQSVLVQSAGQHRVQVEIHKMIDRSSGQPLLKLHPQAIPLSHLNVVLEGQHEVHFNPPIPLQTNPADPTIPNGQQESNQWTHLKAHLPPVHQLTLRWTEKKETPEEEQPHYLTETYQLFTLKEGLLKGEAYTDVDVIRGEVKTMAFELPNDVVLYNVQGQSVEVWNTLPAKEEIKIVEGKEIQVSLPRRVEIQFGTPQKSKFQIALKWQQVTQKDQDFQIPLIAVLNAFQQSGVIALYDGQRVGFKPAQIKGNLIASGQEALPQNILQYHPDQKVSQAFRHIQSPGSLKTQITSEQSQELRFDAQLNHLYSVQEGSIRLQSQILLNLKSGRMDEVTLLFPEECSDPQISGPNINRIKKGKPQKGGIPYEIKLTQRLEGALTLQVEVEKLLKDQATKISFPMIQVMGAELSRGELGVAAEAGLELTAHPSNELRPAMVNELSRAIRLRTSSELIFGYRFTRPWALNADLKRHKVVKTLDAYTSHLNAHVFLFESGFQVYKLTYDIQNKDRRSFKLKLPAHSVLQQIKVNKKTVKARDEEGMLSVLIPKNQNSSLQLHYEVKAKPFKDFQDIDIVLPQVDMKINHVRWLVFHEEQHLLKSVQGPATLRDYDREENSKEFYSLNHLLIMTYDLVTPLAKPLKHTLVFYPQLSDLWKAPLYLLQVIGFILLGYVLAYRRWMLLLLVLGILIPSIGLYHHGKWLRDYELASMATEVTALSFGFFFILWLGQLLFKRYTEKEKKKEQKAEENSMSKGHSSKRQNINSESISEQELTADQDSLESSDES